jgi:hypothetical protein
MQHEEPHEEAQARGQPTRGATRHRTGAGTRRHHRVARRAGERRQVTRGAARRRHVDGRGRRPVPCLSLRYRHRHVCCQGENAREREERARTRASERASGNNVSMCLSPMYQCVFRAAFIQRIHAAFCSHTRTAQEAAISLSPAIFLSPLPLSPSSLPPSLPRSLPPSLSASGHRL